MAHVQIMLDQSLYEDGELMRELNRVYREYEVLSIFLAEAATHCNAFPDDSTRRTLLEKMHTRTVKLSRSLRGFVAFRQSLKGLRYIKAVLSGVAADGIPGLLEDEGTEDTGMRVRRDRREDDNEAEWMDEGEEDEEEEQDEEEDKSRGKFRRQLRDRESTSRKLIRRERVDETEATAREEENTGERRGNKRANDKSRRRKGRKRRNKQKTNGRGGVNWRQQRYS